VRCSVLQHVYFRSGVHTYFRPHAVCCSVLQCFTVDCSVSQCVAVCCSVLQCVAVCCSVFTLDLCAFCAGFYTAARRRRTGGRGGGSRMRLCCILSHPALPGPRTPPTLGVCMREALLHETIAKRSHGFVVYVPIPLWQQMGANGEGRKHR